MADIERIEDDPEVDERVDEFTTIIEMGVERWIEGQINNGSKFRPYQLAPMAISGLLMAVVGTLKRLGGKYMTPEECSQLYKEFQAKVHEVQLRNFERSQHKGVTIPMKTGGLM